MKTGVIVSFSQHTAPSFIADAAKAIEERGFHSIWVPEHVIFFREYASQYPYSADGQMPGNPDGVMEPLTALTFIAAHTQRVRLGIGICILPQRNPVYAAKQSADVDYLSGGRLDFGVGIGWSSEEFAALGIPWKRRAARVRECVAVMQTLWCDEVSEFHGEFYDLPPCLQNPKPVQQPHPPIFFGGESEPALQRVADIGQGWFGFDISPEELPDYTARLEKKLAANDRSRSDIKIYVTPKGRTVDADSAKRYADAGIEQIIVPVFGSRIENMQRRLDDLAKIVGL